LKDNGRRDYTLNSTTLGPTNGVQFITYVDHLLNWKHATSQKKVWSIPISNRGITRRSEVGSRIRLTLITVLLAAVSVGMFVWGLLAVEHAVRVWAN